MRPFSLCELCHGTQHEELEVSALELQKDRLGNSKDALVSGSLSVLRGPVTTWSLIWDEDHLGHSHHEGLVSLRRMTGRRELQACSSPEEADLQNLPSMGSTRPGRTGGPSKSKEPPPTGQLSLSERVRRSLRGKGRSLCLEGQRALSSAPCSDHTGTGGTPRSSSLSGELLVFPSILQFLFLSSLLMHGHIHTHCHSSTPFDGSVLCRHQICSF